MLCPARPQHIRQPPSVLYHKGTVAHRAKVRLETSTLLSNVALVCFKGPTREQLAPASVTPTAPICDQSAASAVNI